VVKNIHSRDAGGEFDKIRKEDKPHRVLVCSTYLDDCHTCRYFSELI
jgi:hypothetical protein